VRETVCLTGGSGGIGQALLQRLVGLYEVKALFRTANEISDKWIQPGCAAVWGDVADEEALSELVTGAKFVFHCAAITQGSYKEAYPVNVEGTRRLARLAATHGCRRFVHVSSVAVYSGAPNQPAYVEDAELCERDGMAAYSLTKLQSEQALKEVAQEYGLEYTILRPTCVYGPNIKAYTLIPIKLIGKGLPVIVGDGRGLLDVVYVDDVARALLLAARSPQANGEVFNIGHETVTLNDFYSHYGRMLNRPARHLPVSPVRALLRLLRFIPGTALPALRQAAGFLIRMSDNADRFPCTKARTLLGYAPEVNLFAGMLKTELWAKREHLIPRTEYSVDAYSPGPIPFSPLAVVHPLAEDDLVQITRIALTDNITAKAIGSLHSLCPIPETEGICVVLDRYDKLLKVEESLVTVQAGMKLRTLNETLAELNLALPILGAITAQTVSGAISTATHGGSIHFGSISDCVESLRIVRADGSILEIDRSQDLFQAVVVSLGLLGIISTVTFRCVPSFLLRSRSSVSKAQQVLEEFDEINRRNLYIDMLYFPVTDEMEMLAINRIESEDSDTPANEQPATSRRPPSLVNTKVARRLRTLGLKALVWLVLGNNSIHRWLTECAAGRSYRTRTARSDRVLAFGDVGTSDRSPLTLLLQGIEIAIPYEQAHKAIALLRSHFLTTQKYPLLPIHIRCSSRSGLWLSPTYKRDVCWLEFWLYPRSDNLSKQQIHELLEPFHYRFHWGKETHAGREYINRQYERWDDFLRLREEWDPTGMFLNSYLEPFFCRNDTSR
jgi:nucleoside-diphosphate-sugar epimerase/FAD/FMN-containing dehydrogenase